MTTYSKEQLQGLHAFYIRVANEQDGVANDYTIKRKLRDASYHHGQAQAFQEAAQTLDYLIRGFVMPGITP